ncbi:MAG: hypothetical protein PHN44_00240, partial [Candidatus Marinimicrobia bacterium]|nr:hypothetical protein [Candidatus Neomarinimicrobiota bacterium]
HDCVLVHLLINLLSFFFAFARTTRAFYGCPIIQDFRAAFLTTVWRTADRFNVGLRVLVDCLRPLPLPLFTDKQHQNPRDNSSRYSGLTDYWTEPKQRTVKRRYGWSFVEEHQPRIDSIWPQKGTNSGAYYQDDKNDY